MSRLIEELKDQSDPGETMHELMAETGLSQMAIIRKLNKYRDEGRLQEGIRIARDSMGRRTRKPVYILLDEPA